MSSPSELVVVLVEPAGPLNVGSVARLCANFEVAELRLVAPRCDHLGAEARLLAVHGAWVLEQARLFPSLAAALADCRRVVATSGRRDGEPLPLLAPEPALHWLRQGSAPLALVFGREDAMVLHSWRGLQAPTSSAQPLPLPLPEPCQRQEIEAMLGDAENLLLEVGFLHRHTAQARMAKLRGLLQRAQASSEEVALVRGMVRQLRWASERGDKPGRTP